MKLQEVLDQYKWVIEQRDMDYDAVTEYKILKDGEEVQMFRMAQFHGCCGIAVCFNAYTNPKYRNQGFGKVCDLIKQLIAKRDGYSLLICTLIQENTPNIKIKETNAWIKLLQFKNERTGNEVIMGAFDLTGSLINPTDWSNKDANTRFISPNSHIFKEFKKVIIENTLNKMTWFQRLVIKLFKIKYE